MHAVAFKSAKIFSSSHSEEIVKNDECSKLHYSKRCHTFASVFKHIKNHKGHRHTEGLKWHQAIETWPVSMLTLHLIIYGRRLNITCSLNEPLVAIRVKYAKRARRNFNC